MGLVWSDFLYFWKINLFLEGLAKSNEASWAITQSVHGRLRIEAITASMLQALSFLVYLVLLLLEAIVHG